MCLCYVFMPALLLVNLLHYSVVFAVVRHHYHDFHPNIGIHLMKLGKIQLYIDEIASARQSLRQVCCSVDNISLMSDEEN